MKKNEIINGGEEQTKIFNRNQKDYKYFINQQRINEINSLQKWINENLRQKQKKIIKKIMKIKNGKIIIKNLIRHFMIIHMKKNVLIVMQLIL